MARIKLKIKKIHNSIKIFVMFIDNQINSTVGMVDYLSKKGVERLLNKRGFLTNRNGHCC